MTVKEIGTRGTAATVRVRADGEVDEESLAYLREKVGTALDRPGLPPMSGEVRVVRASASAHHVELPWSAGADIRIGRHLVTVHAHGTSARELADRLHDRLRAGTERVPYRGDAPAGRARRPPWRGGPQK
ncbi:hypothetical protein ABZ465_17925 [Streptomyces griseoincarnatus]